MKRILIIVSAIASLLLAGSAAAAPYTGPWDSDHQPQTITSPNITVGPLDTMGTYLVLPQAFGCPASWTTTFADPAGSITETTAVQDSGFGCALTNAETRSGAPDFVVTWEQSGASLFLPTLSLKPPSNTPRSVRA